jgi:hypothetical protein
MLTARAMPGVSRVGVVYVCAHAVVHQQSAGGTVAIMPLYFNVTSGVRLVECSPIRDGQGQ